MFGQSSLVRHSTQSSEAVRHFGVLPEHSVSPLHSPHFPEMHVPWPVVERNLAQWESVEHAAHALDTQRGFASVGHSSSIWHCLQRLLIQ